MAKYIPPAPDTNAFNCPTSGVYAHQTFKYVAYGISSSTSLYQPLKGMKVSECFHCRNFIIWYEDKILYPRKMTVSPPSDDVPVDIKKIYNEAGLILNDSPRASGALMRLALELLLKDINKNNLGLNDNIGKLIESKVPEQLIKALTILRVNGNDIMHTGEIKIFETAEDVTYLFELFNMIVEELITRPKKLGELYTRIPESQRKRVEKQK